MARHTTHLVKNLSLSLVLAALTFAYLWLSPMFPSANINADSTSSLIETVVSSAGIPTTE